MVEGVLWWRRCAGLGKKTESEAAARLTRLSDELDELQWLLLSLSIRSSAFTFRGRNQPDLREGMDGRDL